MPMGSVSPGQPWPSPSPSPGSASSVGRSASQLAGPEEEGASSAALGFSSRPGLFPRSRGTPLLAPCPPPSHFTARPTSASVPSQLLTTLSPLDFGVFPGG